MYWIIINEYNKCAGTHQVPSGNAEKGTILAGGRPTNTGVDLRVSDASKDTERGAESRLRHDEELQSAITSKRSTGTALSRLGDGRFWHRTHSRGRDHIERKR